eukprot:g33583.t1
MLAFIGQSIKYRSYNVMLRLYRTWRFTFTCINVVYCIRCSQCGRLYIGEIKWRLGDHFVEHLLSVRDKRQHLPVANYFNSPFQSLGDMPILGILQCHNDATRNWRSST